MRDDGADRVHIAETPSQAAKHRARPRHAVSRRHIPRHTASRHHVPRHAAAGQGSISQSKFGRPFRRLWATFAVSSLGDGFIYGAVPLLAVVVDPRPLAVSAVVAASLVPWLLLAFHAGVLADHFERGRVMAVSNVVRALALGAMAALVLLHEIDLALLIVFVFVNASIRAVYYAASQASVPEMVTSSQFNRANGVLFGTEAATENLAGPVVGAATFTVFRALPFLADAVTMAGSGLTLFGLRTNRPAVTRERPKPLEGFRSLLADPMLRVLVSLIASLAGLQGLVSGILVLVATRDWGVRPEFYGVFLATQAVGNVAGGVSTHRIAHRVKSVWILLGCAGLSGASYLVMAAARSWLLAGAAFSLVGFAVGCGGVLAISLRQRVTPDELMGRVGAAWRGIVWGAAPTGALAAGALATLGGLRLPLIVAGAAQCVVMLLLAAPLARRVAAIERVIGPAAT